MHLFCDCLNIVITSKNLNFSEVESRFSDSYTNDNFFIKERIGYLPKCSIKIQVPTLVKERESGQWRIVECLNCEKLCFATCKNIDADAILVRKDLEVDKNTFNKLQQSEFYSPIFKILIYPSDSTDEDSGDFVDQKTSLCPAAISWLSEQAEHTEERVKTFSDKEYAALDECRKRAYKEQRTIDKLEKAYAKDFMDRTQDVITQSAKRTTPIEKKKPLVPKSSLDDSFDTEGVFLLDGFEGDSADNDQNDDSDSDGLSSILDSEDSAAYQPRKMGVAQLAKSLPIPVPQFMENEANQHNDPLFGSPQVPTDIAASMKALAKSVHGEAIFGELPPPRFSTHL